MSVQLLLRQRTSTRYLLSASSSLRPRSCRRLYSAQHSLDEHSYDASLQAGPSHSESKHVTVDDATSQGEAGIGEKLTKRKKPSRKATKKSAEETQVLKSSRSRSDPSRVANFLSSIAASGQEPTIQDIERYRPQGRPRADSETYTEEYNALVDTLSRSFTKEQLHRCLGQYGVRAGNAKSGTKLRFVKAIIEGQWGWPSLEKVEQERRDRLEVTQKSIEITPSELFIIIGRDGRILRRLSTGHKVVVSVKQKPLRLDVKGVRFSVEKFHESIRGLRKNIIEETFPLPTGAPIPSELRQRISRLADAYLENVGDDGMVRVCTIRRPDLVRAKRVTIRAMSEITNVDQAPVVTHLTEPNPATQTPDVERLAREYALYPFVSPQPLPWRVDVGATFRIRRVGQWMLAHVISPPKEIGLASGSRTVIANDGTETKLQELLLSRVSSADGRTTQVRARLGHVLFSTKPTSETQHFLGPLRGGHSYSAVRSWMANYDPPMFVPSLPAKLSGPTPSGQKILHRLCYRLLKTGNATPTSETDSSYSEESVTLEIALALPGQSLSRLEEGDSDSSPPPMPAQYTESVEHPLDVMLPDRAMDIRFIVSESRNLSESEQPSVLQEYALKLRAYATDTTSAATEPDPPHSWMSDDGKTYVLHDCFAVRQHVEPSELDSPTTSVVVESVLDLDSKQRSAHCEVVCSNPSSEVAWSELMEGCEKLALSNYASSSGSLHADDGETLEI